MMKHYFLTNDWRHDLQPLQWRERVLVHILYILQTDAIHEPGEVDRLDISADEASKVDKKNTVSHHYTATPSHPFITKVHKLIIEPYPPSTRVRKNIEAYRPHGKLSFTDSLLIL